MKLFRFSIFDLCKRDDIRFGGNLLCSECANTLMNMCRNCFTLVAEAAALSTMHTSIKLECASTNDSWKNFNSSKLNSQMKRVSVCVSPVLSHMHTHTC